MFRMQLSCQPGLSTHDYVTGLGAQCGCFSDDNRFRASHLKERVGCLIRTLQATQGASADPRRILTSADSTAPCMIA